MMGKHPYKVWVDLLRLLECPFKMCYALSGLGVPFKDLAVSLRMREYPLRMWECPSITKRCPFRVWEWPNRIRG